MTFRRIDVAEENEMAQEHAPILIESPNETLPIELLRAALDEMDDISAIEALPLHDERFHPQHLFRRTEQRAATEHFIFARMVEPRVVDLAESIARAKD